MSRSNCRRKKPYPDEATAQKAAEYTAKKLGEPMNAYYSPLCGHWHIGHPIGYRAVQKIISTDSSRRNPMHKRRRV